MAKFKTVEELWSALWNDSSVCDYDNRYTYDYAEHLSKCLAQEHFETV